MTAADLLDLARRQGHVIAAAESCTGGLLAADLTAVAGSSDVFDCSYVTYSNAAKQQMLGVSPATLACHGAVSEPVAAKMAQGAYDRSCATVVVAITGIAGPGGSDHKPEGRVCFGLHWSAGQHTQTIEFGAIGRDAVRAASVRHALDLLADCIRKGPHDPAKIAARIALFRGTS